MINPYEKWYDYFNEALKNEIPNIENIQELVYLGIGGSGIPGRILELLDLPIPYQVFRGYKVKYISEKTTIFAVSYSGNTTETIFALLTSLKKTRKIIVITSGGKIEDIAKRNNLSIIKLPKGLQTRFAFPYIFTYLLRLIKEGTGYNFNLNELLDGVKESYSKMNEIASTLASQISGKIPIIYASEYLPIAERFKQEINENAKYPAFYNELPEANHNEIELYSSTSQFHPIVIASDKLDEETANLIHAYKITPLFNSILKNIVSLTLLAGLTSVKLALLLGVNPEKLEIIPQIRERTFKLFEGEINASQNF